MNFQIPIYMYLYCIYVIYERQEKIQERKIFLTLNKLEFK